jgi:hypothetical protein
VAGEIGDIHEKGKDAEEVPGARRAVGAEENRFSLVHIGAVMSRETGNGVEVIVEVAKYLVRGPLAEAREIDG